MLTSSVEIGILKRLNPLSAIAVIDVFKSAAHNPSKTFVPVLYPNQFTPVSQTSFPFLSTILFPFTESQSFVLVAGTSFAEVFCADWLLFVGSL